MNQNQKEEGASNSGDSSAEPATNGLNVNNEAVVKTYEEAIAEIKGGVGTEPTDLPPVTKAARGRHNFARNTDRNRQVKILLPVNAESARIELKRTSKSASEGATIPLKAIISAFGNEVAVAQGGAQIEFLLSDGRSLVGYLLRGKSSRVYVPKQYCAGIEIPKLGYVQPVIVLRLIIG